MLAQLLLDVPVIRAHPPNSLSADSRVNAHVLVHSCSRGQRGIVQRAPPAVPPPFRDSPPPQKRRCGESGMACFIPKPLKLDALSILNALMS